MLLTHFKPRKVNTKTTSDRLQRNGLTKCDSPWKFAHPCGLMFSFLVSASLVGELCSHLEFDPLIGSRWSQLRRGIKPPKVHKITSQGEDRLEKCYQMRITPQHHIETINVKKL